ncbi:MAG: hypothetical protein CVV64_18425 [Candidatus Wallbacteria bacterium HGW-Wallbacteria-1]|jgi:hypothetical protein|uniref:Uncharacterized protein n=1 Tax=Candidatus Wallbacteria bacterium HGW-Wallbacteria-1 TaxID=2013854 RepID=A0A2N1PJL8_9BACT|nr:MAG: hypothetical protein CVV64_18425 [Candidatus Wallbacteria bacterium HGW-Wallbacteria-1]
MTGLEIWKLLAFLGLLNFSVTMLFNQAYDELYKNDGKAKKDRVVAYLQMAKTAGSLAVPFILDFMASKRESLFLFDSGDNLECVGLEIETITAIGSDSTHFIVRRLANESGRRNCDVAFRAGLVQILGRILPPAQAFNLPFNPYEAVKLRLEQDCRDMLVSLPSWQPKKESIFFIEKTLNLPRDSLQILHSIILSAQESRSTK